MCKSPLRFVVFLVFVVASATAQQDTFNVQTQPQPVNPSDAFSSDDCRTNPAQALQEWQAYYQVMRGVIDRRDQEESQGYQSQISSEQNPDIRASIKAHYDYEVNVVDAIWRLNTDSADKCVRNYILSGCKGTLTCPVKPTPPFKEPTFPPSSQPSPGVAKTTCGKFTAIVQSCPRGGPGSHGPLPGTGGIVGPACIMCFWRDANGYPAVHPQIIPAPGFIKSEYDPPGAAVKECGDRLKSGWVAEGGLLCPTSVGVGGGSGSGSGHNTRSGGGSGGSSASASNLPPSRLCSEEQLKQIADWRQREKQTLLCFHWYEQSPNYKASQRLPNLLTGSIITLGPSTPVYNCYGYALGWGGKPPKPFGWIAPLQSNAQVSPPPLGSHPEYVATVQDLLHVFELHSWEKAVRFDEWRMRDQGGAWAVFYAKPGNPLEHVAVWTSQGVYAKMGDLGLFRFDNLKQMEAPRFFGQPVLMMKLKASK